MVLGVSPSPALPTPTSPLISVWLAIPGRTVAALAQATTNSQAGQRTAALPSKGSIL